MNRFRHFLLALGYAAGVLVSGNPVVAQEVDESDAQAWVQYQYQYRLSEKWRGSWDLGYRELMSTEDVLGEWSRLHTRGNFSYVHSRWLAFDLGIGGYYTFSGDLEDLLEVRSWQSAIFFWPKGRLAGREIDVRHRFRLEQRWIDHRDSGDTDFGLRSRYRLAAFIPLNQPTIGEKAWYVPLMGEAFGDLGGDAPDYFAERLRLTVGLGYVLSSNWTLEFRYTAQKSKDTVLDRFITTDHIFDLRIRTAVPLRDLVRSQG